MSGKLNIFLSAMQHYPREISVAQSSIDPASVILKLAPSHHSKVTGHGFGTPADRRGHVRSLLIYSLPLDPLMETKTDEYSSG